MSSFVLDTPEQIEAYRILATLRGLELELKMQAKGWPVRGLPTRGRALHSAQCILASYQVPGPARTRKQAVAGMRQLCQQLGLINNQPEEETK